MKDLNSVQLIGRLGQDPNVQYSGTGTARTSFSVATNRTWTDADGQTQTETEWSRCTPWGKLAEIAAHWRPCPSMNSSACLPRNGPRIAGSGVRQPFWE